MEGNSPILVIEDEADTAVLLKHAFSKVQLTNPVRFLGSVEFAISYLSGTPPFENRIAHPLPGLLLLDLKLHHRSGFETLKWIRSHPGLQSLIVIILSSSRNPQDVNNAYRAGANSYVVKPTSLAVLVDLVQALCLYWLRFNETAAGLKLA